MRVEAPPRVQAGTVWLENYRVMDAAQCAGQELTRLQAAEDPVRGLTQTAHGKDSASAITETAQARAT